MQLLLKVNASKYRECGQKKVSIVFPVYLKLRKKRNGSGTYLLSFGSIMYINMIVIDHRAYSALRSERFELRDSKEINKFIY